MNGSTQKEVEEEETGNAQGNLKGLNNMIRNMHLISSNYARNFVLETYCHHVCSHNRFIVL